MSQLDKKLAVVAITLPPIAIITGVIFYKTVVGNGSTNIFSILFGWQWIYLCVAALVGFFIAIITKKKEFAVASATVLITLAVLLIPARFVELSRLYITGEGGPAGPQFACLIWDNSYFNLRSGAYSDELGLCTLMSIPSYNKFLIDRSYSADQLDASATYYVTLAANELIIIIGSLLAYSKLQPKSRLDSPELSTEATTATPTKGLHS